MIGQIVRYFYKNIYKNVTIFDLLTGLIFSIVEAIHNWFTYFSTKIKYTDLQV